jgi:hypothetical protein
MTKFPLAVLAVLFNFTGASAQDARVIKGLFCNTKSQVEETLGHVGRNLTLAAAVGLTNRDEVACVNATMVRYMVTGAVVVGKAPRPGTPLNLYKATLVGVLIGGNPRPIAPPLPIYFVTPEPMPGVEELTGS